MDIVCGKCGKHMDEWEARSHHKYCKKKGYDKQDRIHYDKRPSDPSQGDQSVPAKPPSDVNFCLKHSIPIRGVEGCLLCNGEKAPQEVKASQSQEADQEGRPTSQASDAAFHPAGIGAADNRANASRQSQQVDKTRHSGRSGSSRATPKWVVAVLLTFALSMIGIGPKSTTCSPL